MSGRLGSTRPTPRRSFLGILLWRQAPSENTVNIFSNSLCSMYSLLVLMFAPTAMFRNPWLRGADSWWCQKECGQHDRLRQELRKDELYCSVRMMNCVVRTNCSRMYFFQIYQEKKKRGQKLLEEEEALSGASFDGVIIAISICVFELSRILPLFPCKNLFLSQSRAVELGLADFLFSSMKVTKSTFLHVSSPFPKRRRVWPPSSTDPPATSTLWHLTNELIQYSFTLPF